VVGIAKIPQDLSKTREAKHHGMSIVEAARRAVLLGSVEGDALLQVPTSRRPCSDEAQDIPERDMGIAEGCRVVDPLS
jgi:hypothetical protein